MSHQDKPVFLNLMRLKFPPMAIVSILHRVSGILIFLFIPFLLYLLDKSLVSRQSFSALNQSLHEPLMKYMLWIVMSVITFHLIAGIRHIMMDFGVAESLKAGKVSAIVVLVLGVLFAVLIGGWLW